jgi:hypothetical protein
MTLQQGFNPDQPPYQFVSGNGDAEHQARVNKVAAAGYAVITMVFDPDAAQRDQRVIVLMGFKS